MSEQSPFFSVEIQGRRLNFSSLDEISNWIQGEKQAFDWMMAGDYGPQFNSFRDNYRINFNHIVNRLAEWRTDPTNDQRAQSLVQFFQSFYSHNLTVMSDHPFAKIALDAVSKIGPGAGVGALAVLLGIPCAINFDVVRGMTLGGLIRDGIEPKSPGLVAKTIDDLNTSAYAEFKKRDDAWNNVAKTAEENLLTKELNSQKKVDEISAQAAKFFERLNTEGNAVIASIQETEASYREQMTLQAPVEYWTTKASTHRTDLTKSRGRLLWFTVFGSVGLIAALVLLSWLATLIVGPQGQDSTAIYLKLAAAGAILTTIVFWVGRVLLRIYLSDRHLLTDAEERVAMIKTYLALSNEKKVEATERALVLAPIFRSAADGIVKDEGPDTSVAGLLARAIDSRRP